MCWEKYKEEACNLADWLLAGTQLCAYTDVTRCKYTAFSVFAATFGKEKNIIKERCG